MVQATYLSEHKNDIANLQHISLDAQPTTRHWKDAKSGLRADGESPILSPENRLHPCTLFIDHDKQVRADVPPGFTCDEQRKILQAAMRPYREALNRISPNFFHLPLASKTDIAGLTTQGDMHRRTEGGSLSLTLDYSASNSRSIKRGRKRLRVSSGNASACLQSDKTSLIEDDFSSVGSVENEIELVAIEIQNAGQVKEYLSDAFASFQQINCRTLCKSWIRSIEPKKQVNHPYNGNLKVKRVQKSSPGDLFIQKESDPEETKPRWWPSKNICPHREPDHIKKDERLGLLCHILMSTKDLHPCSTEDLRNATNVDPSKFRPPGKLAMLDDVWKVGSQLERFKNGEIDGTSIIYVASRKEEARMMRGAGRSTKRPDAEENSEDEESGDRFEAKSENTRTLIPTPSVPTASARYLQPEQASIVPQIHLDACGYNERPSAYHFQSPVTKVEYQDDPTRYPIPVQVNAALGNTPNHEACRHVFGGESFPETSFGNMQGIRSHGDLFPTEEQVTGEWVIPATHDQYSMHDAGEPSQPPAISRLDGNHIFNQYSYGSAHNQPYRSNPHGYSANSHRHHPAESSDELARFKPSNMCSLASYSTPRSQPANTIQQHPYKLPSPI